MQEPILSFIGPLGLNDNADGILNGAAELPVGASSAMSEVFKFMTLKKDTSVQYYPTPITVAEATFSVWA